jgi:hypothetical protein
MEFSLSNGDHGAHANQNSLANIPIPASSGYHLYTNGYSPYPANQPQGTPAGNLSTIAPVEEAQYPRPAQGEEMIDPNSRGREPPRSPPSVPPNYYLYSQEVAAPQSSEFLAIPTPPSPSYKALGKRRASSIEPPTISTDYQHVTPETSLTHEGPDSPVPPYHASTIDRPRQKGRPKSKSIVRPPKVPALRTRVMPSRQRRGTTAYGIGSNPIDAMIIEAQQRAGRHSILLYCSLV